ncbi:alpha/beta-hydrolase, partial [Gonapodya prolifera JEL478]
MRLTRHVVPTTSSVRILAELYQPSITPSTRPAKPVDLVFLHANGIPKRCWFPVIERVMRSQVGTQRLGKVCAFDSRHQGESGILNSELAGKQRPFLDWRTGVDDLLGVVKELRLGKENGAKLLGIGHSFGGAVTLYTEALHPGTFDSIVAIEPVTVHPSFIATGKWDEYTAALAASAKRRRLSFLTEKEAMERWSKSPFFQTWDPDALEQYVQDGLDRVKATHGKSTWQFNLRTNPEDEAACYLGSTRVNERLFLRLRDVQAETLLISGRQSEYGEISFIGDDGKIAMKDEAVATYIKGARHVWVKGGHMIPQENPEAIALQIENVIKRM